MSTPLSIADRLRVALDFVERFDLNPISVRVDKYEVKVHVDEEVMGDLCPAAVSRVVDHGVDRGFGPTVTIHLDGHIGDVAITSCRTVPRTEIFGVEAVN